MLGNPQRGLTSIRIAGSNGKGSTAALLEAILAAHEVRTGLYTSPHLVRVEERIRLAGRQISSAEMSACLERLERFPELTFFETLTLAAVLAFREAGIEVAVMEVGIGGRWDATGIAGSVVAGLTNVGSDHQSWLGFSREAIAAHKGAVLADATVGVLGPGVDEEILPSLGASRAIAAERLVRLSSGAAGAVEADWGDGPVPVTVPLAGSHQVANLHLALALARAAADVGIAPPLDGPAVRRGLASVSWPGRLSMHRVGGREVLLDCAHNAEGVTALTAYLESGQPRFNLLFSCLDDKPVAEMASRLQPLVGEVAVFELEDERAAPLDSLRSAFVGAHAARNALEGLGRLEDPVLATGSLRVVGALLEYGELGG
jgi:dihydrofolate synthase/folylpolyglutamate synthase